MQTRILENLDAVSPKCRQALQAQIKRVQMEAKNLRAQMDELRKAQHAKKDERKYLLEAERAEKKERKHLREVARAEKKERKHRPEVTPSEKQERQRLLKQLAATRQGIQQGMQQRGEQLAAMGKDVQQGMRQRGEQLAATSRDVQQRALQRGKQLQQLAMTGTTLAKVGGQARKGLKRGKDLQAQISEQVARPMRYKRGQQAGRRLADWKDELMYNMLKQNQRFLHRLMDFRDDMARMMRRQSKMLGRNVADYSTDMAWQLRRQRHQLGRNLSYQKDEAARQLRLKGQKLNRHFSAHRTLWSTIGFATGLLVAGGATYWFMQRLFRRMEEKKRMEIQPQRLPSEVGRGTMDETRYPGGIAVATRRSTRAEPTSLVVGVLNTKRYYPIEQKPPVNEQELVFFRSEEDARAEGFTAAR